jgi:hypothetical protein
MFLKIKHEQVSRIKRGHRACKMRKSRFFVISLPYNFLKRIKIDFLFCRLERILIFLIFALSSLLIFCFINRTIRTVSSVSVLNSFLRLLHLLFPLTSYQPAEHKTVSPSKISIILQRRFLIKLLQPRSRSRCSP